MTSAKKSKHSKTLKQTYIANDKQYDLAENGRFWYQNRKRVDPQIFYRSVEHFMLYLVAYFFFDASTSSKILNFFSQKRKRHDFLKEKRFS